MKKEKRTPSSNKTIITSRYSPILHKVITVNGGIKERELEVQNILASKNK